MKANNQKSHDNGIIMQHGDATEGCSQGYQVQSQEGSQGNRKQDGVQEPDPVRPRELGVNQINSLQATTTNHVDIKDNGVQTTPLSASNDSNVTTNAAEPMQKSMSEVNLDMGSKG